MSSCTDSEVSACFTFLPQIKHKLWICVLILAANDTTGRKCDCSGRPLNITNHHSDSFVAYWDTSELLSSILDSNCRNLSQFIHHWWFSSVFTSWRQHFCAGDTSHTLLLTCWTILFLAGDASTSLDVADIKVSSHLFLQIYHIPEWIPEACTRKLYVTRCSCETTCFVSGLTQFKRTIINQTGTE